MGIFETLFSTPDTSENDTALYKIQKDQENVRATLENELKIANLNGDVQKQLQIKQLAAAADEGKLTRQQQTLIEGMQEKFATQQAEANRQQELLTQQKAQEFQSGERLGSQEYSSKESQLAREAQRQQQESQQKFTGSEAEKQRQQEESILGKQQAFTGSEAEKQRQQELLTQQLAQGFSGSESEKQRAQETALQNSQQQFTGSESQKQRDLTQQQFAARQKEYQDLVARGQLNADSGEAQFMSSTENAPEELAAYQEAFRNNALADQRRNASATNLALANQGVTGSQASILAARSSGENNREIEEKIRNLALQDAQARQAQRSSYASNKASQGRQAASSAPSY